MAFFDGAIKRLMTNSNTAAAVPGVGECHICCEPIPCLKLLECGHGMCVRCVNSLIDKERSRMTQGCGAVGDQRIMVHCPECRAKTDVTDGVHYLAARYFGKIKCDLCLGHKETEDMWWCNDCVRAICSKCSIKEHSKKDHRIAEWNKMDQVEYTIQYIDNVKMARQESTTTEMNRRAIKLFLGKVEEKLQKELSLQPELEELKHCLLAHYGKKFDSVESNSHPLHRSHSSPGQKGPDESGSRVVAKVMQLAGADFQGSLAAPSPEEKSQIYFSITPDEVAKNLVSKIELIPLEKSPILGADPTRRFSRSHTVPALEMGVGSVSGNTESTGPQSADAAASGTDMETKDLVEIHDELSFQRPVIAEPLTVDISSNGLVAFCNAIEILVCNTLTGNSHLTPVPAGRMYRNVCFNPKTNDLVTVVQSATKSHEWYAEAWNLNTVPYSSLYAIDLDIDPEDKVMDVSLLVVDDVTFYEIRNCEGRVTEIWRAVRMKKRITGKDKVKEINVYQKSGVRFTDIQVVDTGAKEKLIIAYDEYSHSVHKLICRNQRCELISTIVSAPTQVSYCLDGSYRLWVYDPEGRVLLVTQSPVTAKGAIRLIAARSDPLSFAPTIIRYGQSDGLLRLVHVGLEQIVISVMKPVNI